MRPRKHIGHVQHHIFFRPLVFIVAGVLAATGLLAVDAAAGPTLLPAWLRFDGGVARSLFISLAGATLTIAGLTFWVRAAAVQMAAGQFTPRVVQGFLHDWFQQSIMGLLLGIFAYLVVVVGNTPDAGQPAPNLATVGGIGLAGGSLLAVLWAIRNGVESMQAGELARRITDLTVDRIRTHHPLGLPPTSHRLTRPAPASAGHVVRADASGWVQEIDEDRLLEPLPAEATLQLDVAVGLFVQQGRAAPSDPAGPDAYGPNRRSLRPATAVRHRPRLPHPRHPRSRGRDRSDRPPRAGPARAPSPRASAGDVDGRSAPPAHPRPVLCHGRLSARGLPRAAPRRRRPSQRRRGNARHPGTLARELEQARHPERATSLRRQADLTLQACRQAPLDDEGLSHVTEVAHRR